MNYIVILRCSVKEDFFSNNYWTAVALNSVCSNYHQDELWTI